MTEKVVYKESFAEGQVLLLLKPIEWTSFDLVKKVKYLLKHHLHHHKIKVGHAGTLDPLATGLMILCTGKATKRISEFQDLDKEYIATLVLGKTTPSFDLETEVSAAKDISHIDEPFVKDVLAGFIGSQEQVPPLFSAKNIDGKRAYSYARRGEHKILAPSPIRIDRIELLDFSLPEICIRIRCSKGTYIRALARDIGQRLDSGAYLKKLVRTQIGEFKTDNAVTIEEFEEKIKKLEQTGNFYV